MLVERQINNNNKLIIMMMIKKKEGIGTVRALEWVTQPWGLVPFSKLQRHCTPHFTKEKLRFNRAKWLFFFSSKNQAHPQGEQMLSSYRKKRGHDPEAEHGGGEGCWRRESEGNAERCT